MEEPATESETTTEEDMFGKPVLLGKGMYLPDDDLSKQLTIILGIFEKYYYLVSFLFTNATSAFLLIKKLVLLFISLFFHKNVCYTNYVHVGTNADINNNMLLWFIYTIHDLQYLIRK